MKARILASILAETIRLLLRRHGCACLECARARANLKMIEEEFRPEACRHARRSHPEDASLKDQRFELRDRITIGRYQTKDEALRVAVPGDSLFDREARQGDIELWIVGGEMDRKILRPIRRKHD